MPHFHPRLLGAWLIYNWETGEGRFTLEEPEQGSLGSVEIAYYLHTELEPPEQVTMQRGQAKAVEAFVVRDERIKPEPRAIGQSTEEYVAYALFMRLQKLIPPNTFSPSLGALHCSWGGGGPGGAGTHQVLFTLPREGTYAIEIRKLKGE